jgi:hypothetical protein
MGLRRQNTALQLQVQKQQETSARDKAVIQSLYDQITRLAVRAAATGIPTPPILDDQSQTGSFIARAAKTIKIPDPAIFEGTADKGPGIDEWSRKIRHKLRINCDYFPDNWSQIAYVYSRVGGSALLHLDPRMDPDSTSQYTSVEEILETLFIAFGDQDKRGTALDSFYGLYQRNNQRFTEFWAKFLRLATILKMPDIDQQDALRLRISNDLKIAVAGIEATSAHDLAKKCTVIDHRLRPLRKKQSQESVTSNTSNYTGGSACASAYCSSGSAHASASASASAQGSDCGSDTDTDISATAELAAIYPGGSGGSDIGKRSPQYQFKNPDRNKEYQQRVCFYCKAQGHKAKE